MNDTQRRRMMEMIEEGGHSDRKISRETGVNKNIVGEYKKVSDLLHQMRDGKLKLSPLDGTPLSFDIQKIDNLGWYPPGDQPHEIP